MKSFEDLDCWKKAAALRKEISMLTKKFPLEEKSRLTDQIIRAARSVTANIAEGFGRFHYQEYIQYCRQSRGSLYEVMDHLTVAHEENYISEAELIYFKRKIQDSLAVLNGFINYLVNAKKSSNQAKEPLPDYKIKNETINDFNCND